MTSKLPLVHFDEAMRRAAAKARRVRPLTIYKRPCPPCPSMQGTDPEVEDIMTWPREQQIKTVFPCGWRQKKMCKGYCDQLGVTEADLREAAESADPG